MSVESEGDLQRINYYMNHKRIVALGSIFGWISSVTSFVPCLYEVTVCFNMHWLPASNKVHCFERATQYAQHIHRGLALMLKIAQSMLN